MLFRIYMTSENGYSMVFRKRNISSFILYIISSNSMFEIQNCRNLIFYGVSDDFDYLLFIDRIYIILFFPQGLREDCHPSSRVSAAVISS